MDILDKYSYDVCTRSYNELRNERSEWETDYRQISDYLLPGRGIYQTYSKPRKRKLTSPHVINTIGEDSLYVLTSGLHGRLTSPAMPWFRLGWGDPKIREVEALVAWLQECNNVLHKALHDSNFYSIINSFYIEYAGFGTGSIYLGEDTKGSKSPFRFELLTAGEYAFSTDSAGLLDIYCRTIFLSERQLYDRFPDTVDKEVKRRVEHNEAGIDKIDLSILEYVAKEKYQDKDVVRLYYQVGSNGRPANSTDVEPLEVQGYYEHPYHVARWNTIGSDVYGIGPGSRSISDIKRLQEMERSFLIATHKGINPPLNVPARMRGKLNTLPGGYNYYSNPNETVNELYRVNFDYQGVGSAVERVEQRIQRNFFNDVFLTASRDPNASPLKAAQVDAQEQEQMFRLGPVVERLFSEMFNPLIRRAFNICKRKELFPPLDPALEEMAGEYEITLTSPMATAQRAVKSQGTDAFMGFVGGAAQFDPTILDNINADEAVRERAEIEGVDIGILRPKEEVDALRKQRAEAQKAKADQEQQMAMASAQSGMAAQDASSQKTQAEAGQILVETQQTARESGLQ